MDPHNLERRITPKSGALIIQHTFGIPADMDALLAIARKHNLIVIEDCAHAIGSRYAGKLVGTFGDAAILSFGRDKAFSSVFGGAVILHHPERFPQWARERQLGEMPLLWIKQQLLHPLLTVSFVRPLYTVLGIGKALLVIFQKLGLLSKALTTEERSGAQPPFPPALLPNALTELALGQLHEQEAMNLRRRQIAAFYETALLGSHVITPKVPRGAEVVYLRYPVQCENPHDRQKQARRAGVILGDWYDTVVAPRDTQLDRIGYTPGTCPVAERVAARSLNLPTLPIMNVDDAKRVIECVWGMS
jgi:dTDP-4-amino-4,6-dideoxygalactose transaminase